MHGFHPRSYPQRKMGVGSQHTAWSSRRQRQYIKYGIVAVLLLIVIFNWKSTVAEVDRVSPYTVSITSKNSKTAPAKGAKGAAAPAAAESDDGKQKVAIVTFTTSEKSYTHLSLRNKHAYVRKQNYTLIVDYDAPESHGVGIMWHKFSMIERLLAAGEHDWVWWIDFDTLIMNLDIRVEDVITENLYNVSRSVFPDAQNADWKSEFQSAEADGQDPSEIDFLLTADCFPLNAGSMLVRGRLPPGRKTPLTSAQFLTRVREYHAANASYENQLSEQDCMRDLIFKYDTEYAAKHVHFIPQWQINSFPEEIKCWDKDNRGFETGTLAIHFAGAWAHVKDEDPTGLLMRKYERNIVGESDDR